MYFFKKEIVMLISKKEICKECPFDECPPLFSGKIYYGNKKEGQPDGALTCAYAIFDIYYDQNHVAHEIFKAYKK